MKEEYNDLLNMVWRYTKREVRYAIFHFYHMCFLLHLDDISKMNLPFYFLKSITKMETKVRGFTKSQHNIFH